MHWHQQVPYYQLMQRKLDPDKPCSFFCLCYHSHQSPSHFLIYTSPKCFDFHVWYVCVKTIVINDTAINSFRDELSDIDISSLLNANLATDPNTDYEKFEKIITKTYDRHFPEKFVKFNKYKHKRSNWITSGILKSIEFRDKLHKRLKMCSPENSEYELLKYNLKIYNGYLKRCIRTAKKEFYHNEFNKYKNDIRKTWDTKKNNK